MARLYLSVLIIYGVIKFNLVPLIGKGNARVSFTLGYCTAWASPYALCQQSISILRDGYYVIFMFECCVINGQFRY